MTARTLDVKVYSNVENCRVGTPTWIEVSEPIKGDMREDGLTEYTYSFKIAEAKASRNGEIRFGDEEGYNSYLTITVSQKNPNPVYANFTSEAGMVDALGYEYMWPGPWISSEKTEGKGYEILEPGMTGTSLEISDYSGSITVVDGLEVFPALESLSLRYMSSTETIDLTGCAMLSDLILSNLSGLSSLILGDAPVTDVELVPSYSGMTSESLVVSGENLTSLNVNGSESAFRDALKTLDVTGCPDLTQLDAVREVNQERRH